MNFGSLVDDLISGEVIEDKYVFYDAPKFAEHLQRLADSLIEIPIPNNQEKRTEATLLRIKELNLWSSTKKEELLKAKFDNEEFWGYIRTARRAKESTIILRTSELEEAKELVEILHAHEHSKHIFEPPEGSKIEFQKPLYWKTKEYMGEKELNCKALVDILIKYPFSGEVQGYDLKVVSEGIFSFLSSYFRFKYYYQDYWYTLGIRTTAKNQIINQPNLKFLVISRADRRVMVFNMKELTKQYAEVGSPEKGIKPIWSVVKDYLWHKENQLWEYPREVYESGGVFTPQI